MGVLMSSETSVGEFLAVCFIVAALHNPLWTAEEDATQILDAANVNATKVGGFSWLGCGLLASGWHTEFKGTNDDGKKVEGVVCEGLFSQSYIRYEHN